MRTTVLSPAPTGPIIASPDGHSLAYASADHTLHLFDIDACAERAHFPTPAGLGTLQEFTTDGAQLVAVDKDARRVQILDAATGAIAAAIAPTLAADIYATFKVELLPGGHLLISYTRDTDGHYGNDLSTWTAAGAPLAQRYVELLNLTLGTDRSQLLGVSATARTWQWLDAETLVDRGAPLAFPFEAVMTTPDPKILIGLDLNGWYNTRTTTNIVFDAATGTALYMLPSQGGAPVAFFPHAGGFVGLSLTFGLDGQDYFEYGFDLATGQKTLPDLRAIPTTRGHAVMALGAALANLTTDDKFQLIDLETGKDLWHTAAPHGSGRLQRLSRADQETFVSVAADGTLALVTLP